MKNLFLLGALSVAALAVATGTAPAWFGRVCCGYGDAYSVNYYYRPYNAFDPNCLVGARCGFRPGLCHGKGCVPWCPPCLPCCCDPCCGPGMCCMNPGGGEGGLLPPAMPFAPAPEAPAAPGAPGFVPPMPAPVPPAFVPPMPAPVPPATSQMWYYPMPIAQNPISTASYQPGYYPAPYVGYYPAYPMGYYPVMPASPMPYAPWGMPAYGQ